MRIKTRDINGNYVWLDTETGKTTPVFPTQKPPTVISVQEAGKKAAERAVSERTRRTAYDAEHGRGAYNAKKDRELTEKQIAEASKPTTGDRLLQAGAALASGTGLAMDAISHIPVYSSLKASQTLSKPNKTIEDYLEGAMWSSPLWGKGLVAGSKLVKKLNTNYNDYSYLKSFINRYGYPYKIDSKIVFNSNKLDKLTNSLATQHNRFTRGVSIPEARKFYGFPETWSDGQIAKYTLTHPHSPSKYNSGGNSKQRPVLYTSNSLELSKLYTDEKGYIGILKRPLIWHPDRSTRLALNDFYLKRNPNNQLSATTDEPIRTTYNQFKNTPTTFYGGVVRLNKNGRYTGGYSPARKTSEIQANAGSEIIATQRPTDKHFRHYLFYGQPEEQALELETMFKYTKPEGISSSDYAHSSLGFSRKK